MGFKWQKGKTPADMQLKISILATRFPKATGRALMQETEIEATEARRQTPVLYGILRSTVKADGPFFDGDRIYTMVSAGGPAADYAVYVHEDLDAFHRVGNAKFIERPLMESRSFMAQRVAMRMELKGLVA